MEMIMNFAKVVGFLLSYTISEFACRERILLNISRYIYIRVFFYYIRLYDSELTSPFKENLKIKYFFLIAYSHIWVAKLFDLLQGG